MTRVGDGVDGDFRDGIPAVMAILPEGMRHDGGAQDHKCDHRDDYDGGESYEVFCVLEQDLTFGARIAFATPCAGKAQ